MASRWLPADMAVSAKFAAFSITDITYKVVNNTPVPASVLLGKKAKPGVHPILVRWHGGCLITGHRMYPEWQVIAPVLFAMSLLTNVPGSVAGSWSWL